MHHGLLHTTTATINETKEEKNENNNKTLVGPNLSVHHRHLHATEITKPKPQKNKKNVSGANLSVHYGLFDLEPVDMSSCLTSSKDYCQLSHGD